MIKPIINPETAPTMVWSKINILDTIADTAYKTAPTPAPTAKIPKLATLVLS